MVAISAPSNGYVPLLNTATKATAKQGQAPSSGANGTGGAGDQVTLSPQANVFLKDAKGASLALAGPSIAFNIPDLKAMDTIIAYHNDMRDHMRKTMDFARESFGLGKIEDGGGLALTGDIGDVVKKAAAKAGIVEPEKPAEVKAWEEARNANSSSGTEAKPSAGVQGTSLITMYLPEDKGGGQVELWFDNKGLDKLANLSPDDVKKNLLDLMKGGNKESGVNAAIDNGVLGQFMNENSAWHPEWKQPKARLAYVDPNAPAGSSPLFMIQSKSRPDYVTEHADELVDTVMKMLKAAKG